jgi:WD40 repeat protein
VVDVSDVASALLHGRYEVIAVVGRGGEGTLVRAVDRRHGRDVALKLRHVPVDPRDAERLLVESRTLLSLHPHPGLPLARDDFFEGDRHALVMDWVEGVDLAAVLAEHGQPGLPPSTVLRWLAPVAEALTHLHTTDPAVVHGDVKPANLVLTPSGRVVLVDFGVSSTRGLRPRGGTPGYRAPEVATGAVPTRAADVYGLAATAFALLSGQPPTGILPTWDGIDPQRASRLEQALRRGLVTDPAQRTSTPGELVEELRAGWDSEPLPTGVVTFLATDVVGSTRLWQELPDTAPGLLAEHLLVVDRAVERHGGRRIGDTLQGDSTMSAFHRAGDAVHAGIDLQRALAGGRVQVHCAAHTGEATVVEDDFAGPTLSAAARVRALGGAGQVLLSSVTARLATPDLPAEVRLIDLGPHRLEGFDQPETILAVDAPGLAVPPDPTHAPYRGLVPYDLDDDESYFGRDREIDICLQRLTGSPLLAVVGPSGCGKSSLVRAGIASRLRRTGRPIVVLGPGSDPCAALDTAQQTAGPTTVLVVDQLEELFAPEIPADIAGQFLDELIARLDTAPVVVALRGDHVGSVSVNPRFARHVEAGLHLVGPMTEEELRDVIERPAQRAGLRLEPGLVELLLSDTRGEPGGLPLLSFALAETWANRDGRVLTVDGYLATGGLRQAIGTSAERLYDGLPEHERSLAKALFLRLVTSAPDGEAIRQRVQPDSIITDDEHRRVVDMYVRSRLVIAGDDGLEVAHEALVREWPRLRTWLDDDIDGQRILRHLTVTAESWDGLGRPDSELYRGVRLAQADEWRARTEPDLTPAERTFLDTSVSHDRAEVDAQAQRMRHQARQNRRLRTLLTGTAALLVVALLAGVLAARQARRADRAAVAADARRVGTRALLTDDVDEALLLAVQGVRLDESLDTRANLLAALSRDPALIGVTRGDGTSFISAELSPDGEVAAVGRAWSGLSFYSTSTRELLGTYEDVAAWKTEFRPDGKQLVVSAQDRLGDFGPFPTPAVRLVDTRTLKDEPIQLGGTPEDIWPGAPHYSGDGRFLAVPFESSVLVWDLASPAAPKLSVQVSGEGPAVALSPDGGLLYVGTADPPTIAAYEVTTGRMVRSAAVPGSLIRISPDGGLLATVDDDEIVVVDASTFAERARLRGHTRLVEDLEFSDDGILLASGADDHSAIVWDVATGQAREQVQGRSGGAWGVALSSDDATLYTAGLESALLTWDLRGDRRWIPHLPVAEPVTNTTDYTELSPTGEAVAYISSSPEKWTVQFLDVATGRRGPVIDTGHRVYGWWAWSPDGEKFTTTGADGFVRVWDRRTSELVKERQVAPGHIAGLDYAGSGEHVVVGERAGTISMIDAQTLEPYGKPVDVDMRIVFAFAGPDAHTAVAVGGHELALVDLEDGRIVHRMQMGLVPSGSGDFSPDGRRFALGGIAGELRMLDVEGGEWVSPPRVAHRGTTGWASFAPDGAMLVTGGSDGAVGLWEGRTGAPLSMVVPARSDVFASPVVLPDGNTVLIASQDGTISTWDTTVQHSLETACRIAGRNLTRDEWHDVLGNRTYQESCPGASPVRGDPDSTGGS